MSAAADRPPVLRTVTLSLISHTNAGKTTLARTLLRRDVGEVRDAPNVTLFNESHDLIESGGCLLRLWDTPGFGDSAPNTASATSPLGRSGGRTRAHLRAMSCQWLRPGGWVMALREARQSLTFG